VTFAEEQWINFQEGDDPVELGDYALRFGVKNWW
jgi:hypothetical protein